MSPANQVDSVYAQRPGSAETPVYDDRTRAMNATDSLRQSGATPNYNDGSGGFRFSTASQKIPAGPGGLTANQMKVLIFGSIALLVFVVAATAGAMYFISGDKGKIESPATIEKNVKTPKLPLSAGPVHENPKADSPAEENKQPDPGARASRPLITPVNTSDASKPITKPHPVIPKKRVQIHRQQTVSAPSDDEAFLERIHLKRRRTDATQQWLDIQQKVQER